MKIVSTVILMAILILAISACSLPGSSTATGTQSENTQQAGDLQEELQSINASSTVENLSNADNLPDEAATNVKLVKVVLFFATQDNSALKQEERDIQVTDGAILKACIQALQKGPETEGLSNTIPEGTVLLGISIKDKVATVDLSKEFDQANGMDGMLSRMSIVNTLTRIDGVEKVCFHINGNEMTGSDGQLLGELSPVALNEDGTPVSDTQ